MSRLSELIAELCPDGVEYKALGDLCQRTSNIKWSEHEGEEYQYIDLTSVSRSHHCIESTETIDSQSAPSRAQQIVRVGDILFGATRPTLMRYCEVPSEYDGQIASTGYAVFRFDCSAVLPRFAMYCFGLTAFMDYLEANQKGSAYPAISMRDLKKFRIPVPPIKVQREVVLVLDEYVAAHDDLMERLREEMRLCDQQLAMARNELLTFSERERVRWVTLGDVCFYPKTRVSVDNLDAGSYVSVENMAQNYAGLTGEVATTKSGFAAIEFKSGDVLVGNIRPYLKKVWLAEFDGGTNGDVLVFRIADDYREAITSEFLYAMLAHDAFIEFDMKYAKGAKMPRGDKKAVLGYGIPIPPIETQREIVRVLRECSSAHDALAATLQNELDLQVGQLSRLRNQLLSLPEKAA